MRVFIPVEDGSVDHEVERLVPYRQGLICFHGLRAGADTYAEWSRRLDLSDAPSARHPDAGRAGPPDRR